MNFKRIERREFLKTISIGAAYIFTLDPLLQLIKSDPVSYGPRSGVANPYMTSDGKPILVYVTGTDFQEMLGKGLDTIGGLKKLISGNQDVLIKPNLNSKDVYPAISSVDGIVGVIEAVKDATSGKVYVGDESFHPTTSVYEHINLESAVTNAGAELVKFSSTYGVRRDSWSSNKPDFQVYSTVYDSTIIINFACIKRHFLGKMTCALKNNVGTVSGSGGISTRAYLHSRSGNAFLKEIAEIAGLINPELNIVDARSILTVNGPFSDWGEIKTGINKLIICGDMVATDAYCARILEENDSTFKSTDIAPTLNQAVSLELGTSDLDNVEIIEIVTSVDNPGGSYAPEKFELYQNYPNPFNRRTIIRFSLPHREHTLLKVFDSLGREVETLMDEVLSAGEHSIIYNSNGLASGVYHYRLITPTFSRAKSMVVVK